MQFIGYTSDPNAAITVLAIDVDPCTGEETERSVGAAAYKAGDARNKWTWRADTTIASKYTREYVIRASTGEKLTDNKINAGRYVQPVLEFLFPEPNVPGIVPPINDFTNFGFLAKGLGRDESGNLWGQLSPWPGANAPAAPSCAPASPTSVAPSTTTAPPAASVEPSGAPASSVAASSAAASTPTVSVGGTQTSRPGVLVKLGFNVTNKADFTANDLTYSWTQIEGPSVTLSSNSAANPSFTAAAGTVKTTYTFNIKVTSAAQGTSGSASISVISDPSVPDIIGIDSYTWTSTQSGTISVTANTNIIGFDAKLKLYLTNSATGTAITMVNNGGGRYSYSSNKVKKPANGITIASDFGGVKSLAATTA